MASEREKRVKRSLLSQLEGLGADNAHFTDLVEDYMKLWAIKEQLLADIRDRGAMILGETPSGRDMSKANPAIKEASAVSRQMIAILVNLNLSTETTVGNDVEI